MLEIQDGTLEEKKGGKDEDGVSGRHLLPTFCLLSTLEGFLPASPPKIHNHIWLHLGYMIVCHPSLQGAEEARSAWTFISMDKLAGQSHTKTNGAERVSRPRSFALSRFELSRSTATGARLELSSSQPLKDQIFSQSPKAPEASPVFGGLAACHTHPTTSAAVNMRAARGNRFSRLRAIKRST